MSHQNNIQRRGLPAELANELYASMPLKNAFGLLAKMSNGLLARSVHQMINSIKEALKNNKWNEEDCGSKLIISKDGLEVKHSGTKKYNCVRAILPIPSFMKANNKSRIAFYYEVEILNAENANSWRNANSIGFCDQEFPMEGKSLGLGNSFGIMSEKTLWCFDGVMVEFESDYGFFVKGNVFGIGIIHQPNGRMECFGTSNGDLLGKFGLSSKSAQLLQLFPAFELNNPGDSIRAYFKKEEWKFKNFERVLE